MHIKGFQVGEDKEDKKKVSKLDADKKNAKIGTGKKCTKDGDNKGKTTKTEQKGPNPKSKDRKKSKRSSAFATVPSIIFAVNAVLLFLAY